MPATFVSHLASGFRTVGFAFICLTATPISSILDAQQQVTADARVEARRLRESGDFAAAIVILGKHLEAYPEDGDALRMLAETLYWSKDVARAREVSERALALHPEDTDLRLQYARMLIETGSGNRAREVLANAGSMATGGRAEAILGTLAYWEGDLAGADKLISSAIASGNRDPAIQRIHADIAVTTAPWLVTMPAYLHDDQPIDRLSLATQAGWFPGASTSISVRADALRFRLADTATRSATVSDATLAHYSAQAHTRLELSAGAVTRSFGSSADFTAAASVVSKLPNHVAVGLRAYRSPYFSTEASLSQAVMSNTISGTVRLDHPRGWLGEAAYQLQGFADSNTLTSTYLWLLAPVVNSPGFAFRAGYSGSLENSSSGRFSLSRPNQTSRPGDPQFDTSGSYQPYYTPDNLVSHSAIASIESRLGSATTFSANGSYAFHATEQHPVIVVVTTVNPRASSVQRLSYLRTFNPWTAHASLRLQPSADVSIVADGSAFRTGFYSASGASISLVYRFANRAIRRAGGY